MTEPTIQPIQSHTEILIQQAYDRGYADKAMKVDEAIEMEHSAKGCTRKCHTEPTIDDEIEKIIINVALNGAYEDAGQRVLSSHIIGLGISNISQLISDQVAKARLTQLERLYKNGTITKQAWDYESAILEDNIATLNGVNNK